MRRLHFVLSLFIALFLGYWIGVNKVNFDWNNYHPKLAVVNKEPPPSVTSLDFSMFWTVLDKLQTLYYDKKAVDGQKLLQGAISGMVQSVGDPYTVYLPPTQNNNFKQSLSGQQFSGIGAELGVKDKQIVVIAPLDNSPAQKAGILPGDDVLKVDGADTTGWTLQQAVDKIRGEKGTAVVLTVEHRNETSPKEIKITRDTIVVKSVTGWIKKVRDISWIDLKNFSSVSAEQTVAYIRLSQFGDNSNSEWLNMVNSLYYQIKSQNAKGVIFDLRSNPGGYLTDATFIASEFLNYNPNNSAENSIVVIEDKGNGQQQVIPTVRKGLLSDTQTKIIVLINKGSASASEIVAGALRDNNRATLVGETSFGKGTVQQAEDLGNGAGLHVTIAKWLTPNGVWVNGTGLKPDINVLADTKDTLHDVQLEKAIQELIK